MSLELINLTQHEISKKFFEKILRIIQEKERFEKDFSLGVILVGQDRIRNINKRYRGKNQVTDVLSFPFLEVQKSTKKDIRFIEPEETPQNLGEIFLCPSRVKKQAKKFKKDFKEELALVFVHGALHFFGYKHKDTKTTEAMRKKEKEILTNIMERNKIKNSNTHEGDKQKKSQSFSIIEFITVISIFTILAGIVIIAVPEMKRRGRDSIRIQDLDIVTNALENYYNREGHYPYGVGVGDNWANMNNTLKNDGFLGEVLADPSNQGEFVYSYCVDSKDSQGTMYVLMAKLEKWNHALEEDYDKDWPEGPPPQDNNCCKCRREVGACNPNPPGPSWVDDIKTDPTPYTYCIANP